MPLQATSGAASYDAFGGGVPVVPAYIEEVFSTYLYTGNDVALTVTNGIDLSTKGGLVWGKSRSGSQNHRLYDTARGSNFSLISNATSAQSNQGTNACAFNTDGFSLSAASGIVGSATYGGPNYVSWTFRKQPKFFDVVTYTGDGTAGRQIAHSLNSAPGAIIVKNTNVARDWAVWHRSLADGTYLKLNTTDAAITNTSFQVFGDASGQTSTYFTVGKTGSGVNGLTNANASGETYVAYLFAHDAGGFGLTGTDNVISCGSFVWGNTGTQTVNLGYEPQWILCKQSTGVDGWFMFDTMRNDSLTGQNYLLANSSAAEAAGTGRLYPTATGFAADPGGGNQTYIYIAIRRGPMKVPTSGTSVFAPVARAGTSTATTVTTGFPVDFIMSKGRNPSVGLGENWGEFDRLRGLAVLSSNNTGTEFTSPTYQLGIADFANNTGMNLSASDNDYGYINKSGYNYGTYFLRRAPSFFDEVCYTGTGSALTVNHNLGVAPEMMIVKTRSSVNQWSIYHKDIGNNYGLWFTSNAKDLDTYWNDTTPTNTVFTVGPKDGTNQSGQTIVAYLFATCAGVSKVFSYTGNGSSQTINCGFTAGARWILIKRTDSTGDWYVWDSARGIVSGNDPHLSLNTTAAEVTTDDTIDTDSTGFVVNQVSATNVNVSSATYIGIAIA